MDKKYHWRVLGVLALCAIACYVVGFFAGAVAFVAIGAIFELIFCVGVFRKYQKFKNQ